MGGYGGRGLLKPASGEESKNKSRSKSKRGRRERESPETLNILMNAFIS
jgi:hypothetical protein